MTSFMARRRTLLGTLIVVLVAVATLDGQNPPPTAQSTPPVVTPQPAAPQRGRGPGRPAVMRLTTTAWPDGGPVAVKYTQAGDEVSPPLTWSDVPDNAMSFVLMMTDLDATSASGDPALHWMVWNIPAASRGLPEAVPQGPELPDGLRQIGATGPFYRGPAAPATGPTHHYAFELFALDATIDVPAVGASPAATRTAVIAAMANHVRGKAVLVGLYKR